MQAVSIGHAIGRTLLLASPAFLLAALPLSAPASHAQPAAASRSATDSEDMVRYTVQRGDALYTLARNYLVRLEDWRTLRRINRIGNARAMAPGTVLRVPTRLLKSEPLSARIIGFKGAGQIESDGRATPLALGMDILPGTRIETGPDSFATLELSNSSRITLPSQTRLRITIMRRFLLTDSVDFDFFVERGRVETTATPLGGAKGRYRIRTPIAVSAVRGTTFRIGYEGEAAPSLTEVIEGTVAVAPSSGLKPTPIETGYGASVAASGAMVTEALLPPPELIAPGKVQVDPLVAFTVKPVEDAICYHAQIAADAGFVELTAESWSETPAIGFGDIANGRWFVRVTAIAASGLEGLPQTYSIKRVLTALDASAERGDDGYRFRWSGNTPGKDAAKRLYHFRLRPDASDAIPLVDEPGLTGDSITLSDLPPGNYAWSVGVAQYEKGEESVNWLPEQKLIVAPEETERPAARRN